MKYYVIATLQVPDGSRETLHLYGPWMEIEKADDKIAELSYLLPADTTIELARVLSDEDNPDWVGYDKHEEEENDEGSR